MKVDLHECMNPVCLVMTTNPKYCTKRCSATVTGSTHPKRRKLSLGEKTQLSVVEIRKVFAQSDTVSSVLRNLNLPYSGAGYRMLEEFVTEAGINVSHFKGQGWARGHARTLQQRQQSLLERCARGGSSPTANELIAVGLKERRCERCKRVTWEGELIPLQCDHIDGNKKNNDPMNWMVLCGNCHMLTPTWGNKKRVVPSSPRDGT